MADFRLPIFPLPDVVFFPDTILPLHVFEPRYRRMITDCLAGDRSLAVVMLRSGWEHDYYGRPPVHAVAGVGQIIQSESLSDGRYNVLLDGRMRIRIEQEVPADLPYRVVRARRLPDVLEPDRPALAEHLLTLRAAYVKLLAAMGQGHPDIVERITTAGASPGVVVDRIVSAVVPDAAVRQRILETVNVRERLDLATAALTDLLALLGGPDEDDEGEAEEGEAE